MRRETPKLRCDQVLPVMLAIACAAGGCASTDAGGSSASAKHDAGAPACKVDKSYDPAIDPAAFVDTVDNPLFPLKPGTKLHYDTGTETTEITVLSEKKEILGVSCTVVHDQVTIDGKVAEDTY